MVNLVTYGWFLHPATECYLWCAHWQLKQFYFAPRAVVERTRHDGAPYCVVKFVRSI